MTSSPITSWQIDEETMETVTDFIFLSSRISVDGDCSDEIKGHLFLGRKGMINLGSMLKSRDITLPTKVHLVKAMVFPVLTSIHDYWKNHSFDCMDLCRQSDISDFLYNVLACHSFPSKEQASFDFMATVTICSNFGD